MLPVLFQVGGVAITGYGVFRALGYAAALALLLRSASSLKEPERAATGAAMALVLGVWLGGPLGYLLLNPGRGLTLVRVLNDGSSVAFTAFLGGAAALVIGALLQRRPIGAQFDLVTPSLVGGWAVSNVGCFLAGCCAGPPTGMPWAVRFVSDSTPPDLRGLPAHPVQLYSLLWELAVLGMLYTWPRRFKGELALRALVGLVAMRLAWSQLGGGSGLSAVAMAQAVVAALALGLVLFLRGRSSGPQIADAL